jgi:glycosyltransferase involved in cell wall biosynthesis
MTKFRLAVFNTQPPQRYFGGVERRIMEVTKQLSSPAEISVYSGTKAGFKTPTIINGVTFFPCKSTDLIFPLDNWAFNRSVTMNSAVFEADVFELHNNSAYGLPIVLVKRGINKPVVHVIHGTLADEYEQGKKCPQTPRSRLANAFMKLQAKQEKAIAQKATRIVTISKYSQTKIIKHYNITDEEITIVPNGVDIEKFKPVDSTAAKQQLGLSPEPTVLFMGSLIPRKGLPHLVEAAKKVVKQQENTKFVIIGTGPLRGQIEESVAAAGLAGNFVFLGNLKENQLATAYNAADVFVLPSIQEGQGIVLLEAQACGKPVVAFGVGGVNEAVRQKETGFLLDLGDTEGFADRLLELLGDAALRKKMGAAGRRFIAENYTWDICAQRMLGIYREALAK